MHLLFISFSLSVIIGLTPAYADVYESTCHAIPEEATRDNPDKRVLIYRFTIDDKSKLAFITAFDPQGANLLSRLRRTHVSPLKLVNAFTYLDPGDHNGYKVFGMHDDRTGADYEVSMIDHDFKGKITPDDEGRTETAVTRTGGGIKTHDECNIGE